MRARFRSNRREFDRKNNAFIDMVTGRMARDVEIGIKVSAGTPVKQGLMKASARHFRNGRGRFRVEVNKEYAAVQELGRMVVRSTRVVTPDSGKTFFTLKAGTYTFKSYTTAGTSAGWFARAVNNVIRGRDQYIKEAARAVGL